MTTEVTPDSKIFFIGASASEDFFNALCNCDERELFLFLMTVYKQSPVFKGAVDMMRAQIESELQREVSIVKGEPANTTFRSTAAEEAVKRAMEELGGIYTGINGIKS